MLIHKQHLISLAFSCGHKYWFLAFREYCATVGNKFQTIKYTL